MDCASIDDFLNEDTFLGKFISSFMQRQEVKIFLSSLLNPLIIDIENNSIDNYLGISLYAIQDFIKSKNEKENKVINENNNETISSNEIEDILLNNISKCSIIFGKIKKENEITRKGYINDEMEEDEEEEESEDENDEEMEKKAQQRKSFKQKKFLNNKNEIEYIL